MKLKTLKDLKIGCKSCLGEWVDYDKLRKEAIKWVKFMRKRSEETLRFRQFFNITEEDLK